MTKSKNTILLAVFTIFLSSNVIAKGKERIPQAERVPSVKLEKAMQLVKAHHKKKSKDQIFIDEAVLKRNKGGYFWKIGYRRQAHETGHIYVTVSMSGQVEIHSVVKDG